MLQPCFSASFETSSSLASTSICWYAVIVRLLSSTNARSRHPPSKPPVVRYISFQRWNGLLAVSHTAPQTLGSPPEVTKLLVAHRSASLPTDQNHFFWLFYVQSLLKLSSCCVFLPILCSCANFFSLFVPPLCIMVCSGVLIPFQVLLHRPSLTNRTFCFFPTHQPGNKNRSAALLRSVGFFRG